MKTSLQHLPVAKQEYLEIITEVIRQRANPEMIILFGSYARGNWVSDMYIENGTTYSYQSDYDILVVTEKPSDFTLSVVKKLRYKIRRADWLNTPISLIFHDIKYLNEALEEGSYFFVDIRKEGVILYDTGRFKLAKPKILSPKQRANKARMYYKQWYTDASEFFNLSRSMLKDSVELSRLNASIFILHQAAERFYMTIALVFSDYKPKLHDLVELNNRACNADVRFKMAFPNQNEEEKRKFTVLVKAYIDNRYKLDYTVSLEDLQWLIGRVEVLKELTEKVCPEKIESLEQGQL